jgi:DNA-binding PadR family transcriptional regulator
MAHKSIRSIGAGLAVGFSGIFRAKTQTLGDTVRRKAGTGLVRNELRLLLTAADLRLAGEDRFHGYDIARHLALAEDLRSIMSQPTLYRALRRLEERGALTSEWEALDEAAEQGREGRPRRYYRLTNAGAELAQAELLNHKLQWSDGRLLPVIT